MAPVYCNYCVHCDWEVTLEDHSRNELAALAIEHACKYGHDIDSQPMVERNDSPTTIHEHDDSPERKPLSR